jgi:D-sedoheptulose 7-phosphate isomerase
MKLSYKEKVKKEIEENIGMKQQLIEQCLHSINTACEMLISAIKDGKKIYLCGNGGSAADSEHIACELVGRLRKKAISVGAYSLASNIPVLTAIANDYGYETIFAKQLSVYGVNGDILIALSTSGESTNVMRAAEVAREMKMKVIVLTGQGENTLSRMADIAIMVPSRDTPRIQEAHMLIGHVFASVIEEVLCA